MWHSSVIVIFVDECWGLLMNLEVCWWILRYYIPPQYYPFLKKLGDDTPELKFLGSQLESYSLCNYCFADGLPQSKGLMIDFVEILISSTNFLWIALRGCFVLEVNEMKTMSFSPGTLWFSQGCRICPVFMDTLEGLGWTSWWMAKCDLADCVPHSIHVWYIYLHLPYKSIKCR